MAQAKAKGYVPISTILKGSGIKSAKANAILMKRGYLRLYDEGEESVQQCKVPSDEGLELGAVIVRGEKESGEVYYYARYPQAKAKEICDLIESLIELG